MPLTLSWCFSISHDALTYLGNKFSESQIGLFYVCIFAYDSVSTDHKLAGWKNFQLFLVVLSFEPHRIGVRMTVLS